MLDCYTEQLAAFAAQVRKQANGAPLVPVEDAVSTGRLIDWAVANRRILNEECDVVQVTKEAVSRIKGRIAVTGATGFVGTRLLGALSTCEDAEVVSVVRSFRNGAMAGRFAIETVRAELLKFDEICAAFRGAQHVFHLAYGSDGADASRTTIEGTLNACKAAVREGAQSVVVVGTTAVYGPQMSGVIVDESYPMRRKGSEYELAKAEMVRQVLSFAQTPEAAKTRIIVVEPACIYGPGGKPFTELPLRLAQNGEFAWIEEGKGTANVVYVDSLVDALLKAAVTIEASGHKIIVQDCAVTWREFLTPLLGKYAKSIPSITVKNLKNQPSVRMKDVLKAALRSPEFTKELAAWPWAVWGRKLLDKRAKGMMRKLRDAKRPLASDSTNNSQSETTGNPIPVWLATAFGTESPRLSNLKAQKLLGWAPLALKDGHSRTLKWLEHVRLSATANSEGETLHGTSFMPMEPKDISESTINTHGGH